ncbi:MAG TPA: DUF4833 domain-containing protein [Sphingobacteriaceae bacterium]|nr:DUF4833 domain-containing protein [Sphingobacteriaceae bacterium]
MDTTSFIFRSIIKTTSGYLFLAVLFIFVSSKLHAQSKDPSPISFPTPKNVDNMLFYLQRDPNTNTLIYTLNLDAKGNINKSDLLNIYWIRYAENREKKELGFIQRKLAYDMDTRQISKDKYELRFVSHRDLVFLLQRSADKGYYVSVFINNRTIRVSRIFVRIEGGTFWFPNVKYAEIEGTDQSSGKPVTERISAK